jgi:predicted AAA+ superfamily ATPase
MTQFPAVVVAGARQVGKSTLLQHMLAGRADYVTFDPLVDVEAARAEPELFLDNHRRPLVLDEIQFAPQVVPALKRRIDLDRTPGQYLLTGSQQWEVLRALQESLAGRVVFLELDGFALCEIARQTQGASWLELWLRDPQALLDARPQRLGDGRALYERLWRGFLPETESLALDVIPDFHAAYVRTYIERDARQMGDVSNWQTFSRFYRLAAALTAQEVNKSELGRELGLTPQTASRWLDVLRATFQWHDVGPWSGNAIQRVSRKPKGYFGDTGLVCASLRISSPQALADHPSLGAIYETAVVAELRKLVAVLPSKPILHHWRAHGGPEVDVLLERDGKLHPIEIKATARPTRADVRGIEAFRRAHPKARIGPGLVLCPTPSVARLSELDTAVPWDLAPLPTATA